MRILHHIDSVNRENYVTNESKRDEAEIEWIAVSMRSCRLQWCGYARWREREEDVRMVDEMRVQGRKNRGKP